MIITKVLVLFATVSNQYCMITIFPDTAYHCYVITKMKLITEFISSVKPHIRFIIVSLKSDQLTEVYSPVIAWIRAGESG